MTAGGGFAGTGGGSSSFHYGFLDDMVHSVEMALAHGEFVTVSREERFDLLHMAAGAVGTLGIVAMLAQERLYEWDSSCQRPWRQHLRVLMDEQPDDVKPHTFSGAWDPWFYQHVVLHGGMLFSDVRGLYNSSRVTIRLRSRRIFGQSFRRRVLALAVQLIQSLVARRYVAHPHVVPCMHVTLENSSPSPPWTSPCHSRPQRRFWSTLTRNVRPGCCGCVL